MGDDTLNGGAGNDDLHGGVGDDALNGGSGNDHLFGNAGADVLHGGAGDDVLSGELEQNEWNSSVDSYADINNKLYGDAGNDRLEGGSLMDGGAGDDDIWLLPTTGTDVEMTGGEGQDTFHLSPVLASDPNTAVITDFDPTQDIIKLAAPQHDEQVSYSQPLSFQVVDHADGAEIRLVETLRDGTVNTYSYAVLNGIDPLTLDLSRIETFSGARVAAYGPNGEIYGTEKNDELFGTSANEVMNGFGDNDTLVGDGGADVLNGGEGSDRLYGEFSPNFADIDPYNPDHFTGVSGNDVLNGNGGYDQLYGQGGDDTLNGGAGGDFLDGGLGWDILNGGDGDDTLRETNVTVYDIGGPYMTETIVTANHGTDNGEMYGGAGNDTLIYGKIMDGGDGDDVLRSYIDESSTFTGGAGQDQFFTNARVTSGGDFDVITDFNADEDVLTIVKPPYGDFKAETINDAPDYIRVVDHADGAAIEIVRYFNDGTTETYTGAILKGIDAQQFDLTKVNIHYEITQYGLYGEPPHNVEVASHHYTLDEPIIGTGQDDILNGTGGNDVMNGLSGDDTLNGGAGDDTIDGGGGYDTLHGGDGNDVLTAGTDTGQTQGEGALYGDAGDDTLSGQGILDGGTGNDTLFSHGAAVMTGGDGIDHFRVGEGGESFRDWVYNYYDTSTITDFDPANETLIVSPNLTVAAEVGLEHLEIEQHGADTWVVTVTDAYELYGEVRSVAAILQNVTATDIPDGAITYKA